MPERPPASGGPRRGSAPGSREDRAQSQALGFVLVFGLVIGSIGLVTATGFAGLERTQEVQRTTNAATAFEMLSDDAGAVRRGAPLRETTVDLAGGRLSLGDPVTVRVSGVHATNASRTFARERRLQPVVYANEGTRLVYENGAVFRVEPTGTAMLDSPAARIGSAGTLLPIVQTWSAENRSVGGSTTAGVELRRQRATALETRDGPYDVTIEVTSPRAEAWRRWLDSRSGVSCSPVAGDTVSCSYRSDGVTLAVSRIGVSIR